MCQHMPYGTSGLSASTAPTPVSQVLLKLGGIEPREPSSGGMDKCPPLLPSAEGAPFTPVLALESNSPAFKAQLCWLQAS